MIALLGALKEELSGVVREMTIELRVSYQGWRLWQGGYAGKDVLLVQTGMRKDCARQAAQYILEHYPIKTVISIGFGGALDARLGVGDLVLCHKLLSESHAVNVGAYCSDPDLISLHFPKI